MIIEIEAARQIKPIPNNLKLLPLPRMEYKIAPILAKNINTNSPIFSVFSLMFLNICNLFQLQLFVLREFMSKYDLKVLPIHISRSENQTCH